MNANQEASPVRRQTSPAEWKPGVDLAALYRLVAAYGWNDLLGGVSACVKTRRSGVSQSVRSTV